MIEHVISRNCRVVYRGFSYELASKAWRKCKADSRPRDVARWDHESSDRADFAPDPHCGLVTVPAIYSGGTLVHPQRYVLTVAKYENDSTGRKRGMGSPKLGAI